MNPALKLLFVYLIIIFIGAAVLMIPFSLKQTSSTSASAWNYLNAIFTTTSAFSNTGFSLSALYNQFSIFGQIVLLVLVQVGGLGIIAFKLLILLMIGKKFGLLEKITIVAERGSVKLANSYEMLRFAIIFIFGVEFISTFVLATYLHVVQFDYAVDPWTNIFTSLHNNYGTAIYYGFFHSVTAINNCGFDIFGDSSFYAFRDAYFWQFWIILLFVVGGLGFPVFYEISEAIKAKINRQRFHFSLFTKVATISYLVMSVLGIGLVFLFESLVPANFNHYIDTSNQTQSWCSGTTACPGLLQDQHYSISERIMFIVFNTMSTRNAGFSTVAMQRFAEPCRIIQTLLMWIGASPCSTAGGIRSTTFVIVCCTAIATFFNRSKVLLFRRQISSRVIVRSTAVALIGLALMLLASLLVSSIIYTNTNVAGHFIFIDILFDTASAFGTTGLTTGFVLYLTWYAKVIFIFLMIIGQLTISNTILIAANRKTRNQRSGISFPEEDIIIG